MIIAHGTDIGNVRAVNEDSHCAKVISDNCAFAVVADGMGGHRGGRTASSSAVDIISEYISARLTAGSDADSVKTILSDAIKTANEKIYIRSLSEDELSGMGTTIAAVICSGDRAYAANVGDSRIYAVDGTIRQISRDHSYVQGLLEKGLITTAEANKHPNKNIITRAVGTEMTVDIDLFDFPIRSDTRILLCTDGLSNFVPDALIEQTLNENEPQRANELLIALANNNGGKDNITVVNMDFNEVTK